MSVASLIGFGFAVSIFLSVLTVGLRVGPAHLDDVLCAPSRMLRALVAMNVIAPAIAILICKAFSLHPAVSVALVTLSVAPVSPLFAKAITPLMPPGYDAYPRGMFFVSTMLSVLLTPIMVEAMQLVFGGTAHVNPVSVAEVAIGSILLPLAIGFGIRHWRPAAKRLAPVLDKLSSVLLLACAVPIIVAAWPLMPSLLLEGTFAAIVLFTFAALAMGHSLGGPNEDDRTALAFATASRHPGVAVVVATLTDQPLAPVAVLLAIVVSHAVVLPYKLWRRRMHTEASAAEHHPTRVAH